MPTRMSRRALLHALCGLAYGSAISGCGTIFYPERRGQAAGPLDWKVVALDAIGLVFFFVPGVIAFAVDFNNGTIYLPAEECAEAEPATRRTFAEIPLPRDHLSLQGIETAVSTQTKRDVRLERGRYETHVLSHINEFWRTRDRLLS